MHTRRTFLWTVGAGLWTLASGKTRAQTTVSVPSPSDIVKQFVAARAAQDYTKAYALLSADTQKFISLAQFANANFFQDNLGHPGKDEISPLTLAVFTLFTDTHNTAGQTFSVVGPDPVDRHTVLVNAQTLEKNAKSLALRVVTAPDAQSMPRLGMEPSFLKTDPEGFTKTREQARQAASESNLKQISLSIIQYEQDHKLHLPDAAAWTDAIQPYLGNTYMLHGPSAPDGKQFSYAFNRALSGVSLNDISNPAQTVLAFTSTLNVKNATDTGQSLPKTGWHSGGSIVAFCDGHVQWVKDGMPLDFAP